MALIFCPECGKGNISDSAVACPNCGFPIADYFRKMAEASQEAGTEVKTPDSDNVVASNSGSTASFNPDITVESLCKKFLDDIGEEASSFEFTVKQKKRMGIPDDAVVYLAHDDTVFKSGKNGFVITDKGIYGKNLSQESYTSLNELKSGPEIIWNDSNHSIESNGRILAYYTDSSEEVRDLLIDLYGDIISLLSKGYVDTTRREAAVPVSDQSINETQEEVDEAEEVVTVSNESTEFFMRQKLIAVKPKFDIFDRQANPVYHVAGDLTRLNYSIQRNGTEVLKLKKKMIAVMPEYTIEKDHTVIANIKKKFKLTSPELKGQVCGKELKISGDLFGYDYDILLNGNVIGHVDTAFGHWSDCYCIHCYDPSMQDVLIALAVICDMAADKEEEYD